MTAPERGSESCHVRGIQCKDMYFLRPLKYKRGMHLAERVSGLLHNVFSTWKVIEEVDLCPGVSKVSRKSSCELL